MRTYLDILKEVAQVSADKGLTTEERLTKLLKLVEEYKRITNTNS